MCLLAVLGTGIGGPALVAQERSYWFCSALDLEKKKFFVTELFSCNENPDLAGVQDHLHKELSQIISSSQQACTLDGFEGAKRVESLGIHGEEGFEVVAIDKPRCMVTPN